MKDFTQILAERASLLENWLRENGKGCWKEQRHLDAGSPERIYWNYGYLMALKDVLRLICWEQPWRN